MTLFPPEKKAQLGEPMNFAAPRKLRISELECDVTMSWAKTVIFQTANQLTHLSVENTSLDQSLARFIPWAKLQSIQLVEVELPLNTLLHILGLLPNLSFLNLHDSDDSELETDSQATSVTLASHKCFHLYFGDSRHTSRLLAESICAPKLDQLKVSYVSSEDLETAEAFLRSSSCSASVSKFKIKEVVAAEHEDAFVRIETLLPVLLLILQDLSTLQSLCIHLTDAGGFIDISPLLQKLVIRPNRLKKNAQNLKAIHIAGQVIEFESQALRKVLWKAAFAAICKSEKMGR